MKRRKKKGQKREAQGRGIQGEKAINSERGVSMETEEKKNKGE